MPTAILYDGGGNGDGDDGADGDDDHMNRLTAIG